MIRRSTKDIAIIFISFSIYLLLSVFWPDQPEDRKAGIVLACILHAIFYHLVALNFSGYCTNKYFLKTPLAISCLLLVVYLGAPFIKYYGEARYIELDVELQFRLLGLLVICVAISLILKLYAKRWILFHHESIEIMRNYVGSSLAPFMYFVFGLSTFYLITGGIFSDNEWSAAQTIFIMSGYFTALYYFALFGAQQKAFLNEVLFVCGGLAITYYTGQRFALLLAVLLLVFARISRIETDQERKSLVLLSILVTPLALLLILGPLTTMTKTRYGEVDLIFELQRTDFADFVGAASVATHKENVLNGLHTSLLWAVPGSFMDKEGLQYSMEPFFEKNNWRKSDQREGYSSYNIDYIDSIFSSGAMVGGFIGALLLPLAWYGFLVVVLSYLKNTMLLSFYLTSIPAMFNIEIAFWSIVPTLRNWFVMSMILYVVLQLLIRSRHRFSQNE